MLSRLQIENVAVIEKAELALDGGLNVLTGETGAGKSILIDSINLVLGERVSRDIVRTGAPRATVTALFTDVSASVTQAAEALGYESEDASLLLQRDIAADGRGSCRINGRPATVSLLRELGRLLVNTHGQHDNQALLSPEKHMEYLDSFAGLGGLLERYRGRYGDMTRIQGELGAVRTDEAEKARRTDLLTYQLDEIGKAALEDGEEEELKARRDKIANAEKIAQSVAAARDALSGGEETSGAVGLLEAAASSLEEAAEWSPELGGIAERLRAAAVEADEAGGDLRGEEESLDFDPRELEEIELRLDAIYRLKRKYGGSIAEILRFRDRAQEELEAIENSDETAIRLQKELEEAVRKAGALAGEITAARKKAARAMREQVLRELAFLDMPGVQFTVSLETLPAPGPDGAERAEFLISANPGSPPRPLVKIASGGELSRVMLAIKNVLADRDDIETAIFDEIDTGVSGRAAQKIGRKLREVARGRQVLCVTHLAQIASQADRHILIEKQVRGGNTYTLLRPLDFEGRKRELARIIGGDPITGATLKTAEEMLESAGISHELGETKNERV